MDDAAGNAGWHVTRVINKLSDELVAAFVAGTSELGLDLDSEKIKADLTDTQDLLHGAHYSNPDLQQLLAQLCKKASEAEDTLDELLCFLREEQLDGTQGAAPEVRAGGTCHALRQAMGNWLPCFSCSTAQHDIAATTAVTSKTYSNTTKVKTGTGNDSGHLNKLPFDRVAMCKKIKLAIEGLHTLCYQVSDMLKTNQPGSLTGGNIATAELERLPSSSYSIIHEDVYGRVDVLDKAIDYMTSDSCKGQTLSVLAIVGPGGVGKTTLAQLLYNHDTMRKEFSIMVWISVSTDFDVLTLSQEILWHMPATDNEDVIRATEITNLDQLQKSIVRRLENKRLLLVLDDVWTCENEDEWKELLAPFKKGNTKGNMILVTTRFLSIAHMLKTEDVILLDGLDSENFFRFFISCIFGKDKAEHHAPELLEIARKIAMKLKGSPLAAKTVGRLLRKNLSVEHWMKVLENNERQFQEKDDIIASLKLSYDRLPFKLKLCFSFCSLFPEDYKFDRDITRFWRALGVIDSSVQEATSYLQTLVDVAFFIKTGDNLQEYYVIHDLLQELAQRVSSQDCCRISSFRFRADDISPSIRHLSITIQDEYDANFEREMNKLKTRIDIANLRTLMIFGRYEARVLNIFEDAFKETKRLHVLFLTMDSLQYLTHKFSNFIHLRYLKIQSPCL